MVSIARDAGRGWLAFAESANMNKHEYEGEHINYPSVLLGFSFCWILEMEGKRHLTSRLVVLNVVQHDFHRIRVKASTLNVGVQYVGEFFVGAIGQIDIHDDSPFARAMARSILRSA